jgi:TrmH family RNA methyltransferase
MKVSRLTSKDNPLLKRIRHLASGSSRSPQELAIAEGIRVLEEVNNAGCEIDSVVFSEQFGSGARERLLLNAWLARGVPLYEVKENLFASVSSVQSPQGALALVRVPALSLTDVPRASNPLVLFACGIQDPGNLGTLLRTAAAAGATLFCTASGTVSVRNPKVIRSSAGALFHLPLVEHVAPADFLAHYSRHSIRLYRADTRDGIVHTQAELRTSCAILLGNESAGVAEREFAAVPAIRIPMAKGVESLNVAMAGAIILFEAARQRSLPQESGRRLPAARAEHRK